MATAAESSADMNLTENETEIVKTFCKAVSEKGDDVPWDEALKLVTARKFNLERALDLYEPYKELRKQLSLDSLNPGEDPLRAELAVGKFTILDCTSKEGARIAVFTTSLFTGFDSPAGKELLLQNILFNVDECLFSSAAQRYGIILLINLQGAGARISDRHLAVEILDLLQDRYPARVTKVYVIDAPWWARAVYNIVWPFLKEKTRSRVEMISQNGLRRHIDPGLLPVTLGGNQPSTHDDWIRTCTANYLQRHRRQEAASSPAPKPPVRTSSQSAFKSVPGAPGAKPSAAPPAKDVSPPAKDEPAPPPPERRTSLKRKGSEYSTSGPNAMTVADLRHQLSVASPQTFAIEYGELRTEAPRGSFATTRYPLNLPKNRYADILALEETRVHLATQYDEYDEPLPGSDYINANFVSNPASDHAYIACQGPLPNTFEDFWRMVWEYRVRVVVMTTKLVERGRVKCDEYWPVEGGVEIYGSFELEMTSEHIGSDYSTRQFRLTNTAKGHRETRDVTQYQFTAWPDFGLPATASSMLEVIANMHTTNATAATTGGTEPPVVVHCSAGVGRTGTLMATDIACQCIVDQGKCDIHGIVRSIRSQRAFSVQTPDQYQFIFMAALEYGEEYMRQHSAAPVISGQDNLPPIPQERSNGNTPLPMQDGHTGMSSDEVFEKPVDCPPSPSTDGHLAPDGSSRDGLLSSGSYENDVALEESGEVDESRPAEDSSPVAASEEPVTAAAESEEPVTAAAAESEEPVTAAAESEEPVTAAAESEEPVTASAESEEPAPVDSVTETQANEQVEEESSPVAATEEPVTTAAVGENEEPAPTDSVEETQANEQVEDSGETAAVTGATDEPATEEMEESSADAAAKEPETTTSAEENTAAETQPDEQAADNEASPSAAEEESSSLATADDDAAAPEESAA